MSPLKQYVDALAREVNRLWAKQNPPGTPPLVPLPNQLVHEDEVALRAKAVPRLQDLKHWNRPHRPGAGGEL